jgi:hypothetical protein
MSNKLLLTVASTLEAVTGLVLVIAPSSLRLLLGTDVFGAAVITSRCLLAARGSNTPGAPCDASLQLFGNILPLLLADRRRVCQTAVGSRVCYPRRAHASACESLAEISAR